MDGCLQMKHKDDQVLKSSKLFQISTTILHSSVMLPYLPDTKEHSQETENKWCGAAVAVRVSEEEESAQWESMSRMLTGSVRITTILDSVTEAQCGQTISVSDISWWHQERRTLIGSGDWAQSTPNSQV